MSNEKIKSKVEQYYLLFNIVCILLIVVFYIIQVISGIISFLYVVLSVSGVWILTNASLIVFDIIFLTKLKKNIQSFLNEKRYDDCIDYLNKMKKKTFFIADSNIVTYYLGYINLLLGNTETGINHLKSININNLYQRNVQMMATAIYFLYLYGYTSDADLKATVLTTYKNKHDIILKCLKNNEHAKKRLSIIDSIEAGEYKFAATFMKNDATREIPFVRELIDSFLNKQ